MILLLLCLLPIVFLLYGCYLWRVAREYNHLPGKLGSSFPVIGNLYQSLRCSFLSHDDLQSFLGKLLPEKGGFCCIWFFNKPVVAVSDPHIVEQLAVHPAFVDKEPLVYENAPNLWKGVFTYARSDKEWKQRRKELNNSMKNPKLVNYHDTFIKTSKRIVDKMKHEKGIFNIRRYVLMAALDTVLETHAGYKFNTLDSNELFSIFSWGGKWLAKAFLNPILGFFLNIFFPILELGPLRKLCQISQECTEKTISSLKEEKCIEDSSDLLFAEAIVQRNLSNNKSMKEINAEIMELILVGSYTVGGSVSSALVFLASLPEIQEKAWQEQQGIFGDSDREPTIEDVKRMDYLDRFFKEVVRFVSAATLVRNTKAEINIDGKIIPCDSTVLVLTRMMRMDSKYWKNPEKFDPDRYLREEPPKNFNHAFSFFGLGIRNCPGVQYVTNQGKVILSTIIRHFEIVTDKRFENLRMTAELMTEIADGHNVSIIQRKV